MDRFRTKLTLLILASLLTSSIITSSSEPITVWGPAKDYRIAYVHSISISINESIIIDENNLPVTEFKIDDISAQGYNYTYNGFGDHTFQGSVIMEEQGVNGVFYEYPEGSFPVMLPLSYQSQTQWIPKFKTSFPELLVVRDLNRIPFYFRSQPEIVDNLLVFDFESSLNSNVENLLFDEPVNLPAIKHDSLNGSFSEGKYEVYISYNLKTGVLFEYEYLIKTEQYFDNNGNDLGSLMISQSIEFVILIPPTNITDNFLQFSTSIILSVILLIFIFRRRD